MPLMMHGPTNIKGLAFCFNSFRPHNISYLVHLECKEFGYNSKYHNVEMNGHWRHVGVVLHDTLYTSIRPANLLTSLLISSMNMILTGQNQKGNVCTKFEVLRTVTVKISVF